MRNHFRDVGQKVVAASDQKRPDDAREDRAAEHRVHKHEPEPARPDMPPGGLFSPEFIDWYIGK